MCCCLSLHVDKKSAKGPVLQEPCQTHSRSCNFLLPDRRRAFIANEHARTGPQEESGRAGRIIERGRKGRKVIERSCRDSLEAGPKYVHGTSSVHFRILRAVRQVILEKNHHDGLKKYHSSIGLLGSVNFSPGRQEIYQERLATYSRSLPSSTLGVCTIRMPKAFRMPRRGRLGNFLTSFNCQEYMKIFEFFLGWHWTDKGMHLISRDITCALHLWILLLDMRHTALCGRGVRSAVARSVCSPQRGKGPGASGGSGGCESGCAVSAL